MMNANQERVYNYIKKCLDKGYSPSVREICSDLGIASTSTAARYINSLVSDGYLEKDSDRQRSLRLAGAQPVRVPVLADLADSEVTEYAPFVPYTSGNRTEDLFGVIMPDDALRGSGILKGDIIIAVRRDYLQKGDVAVALSDGKTVVRRFVSSADGYALSGYDELIPMDRCRVVGKGLQIIRRIDIS